MHVELLAHTLVNPLLAAEHPVLRGRGTLPENMIEFAGRVCYRSDDRMGHNPGFIHARVREGHEDIVEHIRLVFRVEGAPLDRTLLQLTSLPTVEFSDLGEDCWVLSMNARNVRDFWNRTRSELALALLRLASAVAPEVYTDLGPALPQEATA